MARYMKRGEHWERAMWWDGKQIYGRFEFGGVYRTCVEGSGGGEHACSGKDATRRALEQAVLRIEDMNKEY